MSRVFPGGGRPVTLVWLTRVCNTVTVALVGGVVVVAAVSR